MKKKILLGVVIPLVVILLAVGAVGAVIGFQFWQGQANVTVLEGMTVVMAEKSGGTWDEGAKTWTITGMKAGESRFITFVLTNTATSGTLTVTPLVAPASWPGFGLVWSGNLLPSYLVNFGEAKTATFTITAAGDCTPGTSYVFTLTFSRS